LKTLEKVKGQDLKIFTKSKIEKKVEVEYYFLYVTLDKKYECKKYIVNLHLLMCL